MSDLRPEIRMTEAELQAGVERFTEDGPRTIKVRIAEERLDELDAAVREALDGDWYIRLSAPEVAVLVATYRERAPVLASAGKEGTA